MSRGSKLGVSLILLALADCGPAGGLSGQLSEDEPGPGSSVTPSGSHTPEAPPPDGCPSATLAELQSKVFASRCSSAGCHAASAPAEALDLSGPIEALRARLLLPSHQSPSGVPLVTPRQVGSSFLYLKSFFRTPVVGDAMPPDAPLESCELAAIRRWIENGASD